MSGLSRVAWIGVGGVVAWVGACGSTGGTGTSTSTASSSSSTTATTTSSGSGGAGGASSSSATSSSGGSGGSGGATCGIGEKVCADGCRLTTDPAAGCASPACAPCLNAHGITACAGGVCAPKCHLGWGDCDGDPVNGCEHDVLTDPQRCGACAIACVIAHGTPGCVGGVCVVAACDAGFADCDADATNGCEASVDGGVCP